MDELKSLVKRYNSLTGRYLYLYVAAMAKRIPGLSLEQEDFYIIRDMLKDVQDEPEIDVYIETPGGNGVTAEEIARFLHKKFSRVNFIVSGEAKSAGTILALSGNDIYMTETGSLGPIDAQIHIGRSVISAYDYMEWINAKMQEAAVNGKLNPVDATMVAQITPGEIQLVNHSLEFAKDLVKDWLYTYKFSNWKETSTQKIAVTDEMKKQRANEVADEFANHSRWRTHGRSLKISDLEEIGLTVNNLEEVPEIADVVYRIQFVCKLLLETTSIYKLFFDVNGKIIKQAVAANIQNEGIERNKGKPSVVQIEVKCEKCGKPHRFYKKLTDAPEIDVAMKEENYTELPEEDFIKCDCNNQIDLKAIKNEIEMAMR
ncbi:MAG: ATP-dependent Clp protease proteolytic subunit [Eubacterium sp.]|nr:ATP-dependent Clp protease proteolytic subunit [Eubacterium sp.]